MHWFALDTETEQIKPGLLVPRLVCVSWATHDQSGVITHEGAADLIKGLASTDGVGLIFHNAPYDLAVLIEHDEDLLEPLVELPEAGRIVDVGVIEQLQLIRAGTLHSNPRPSLASMASKHLNEDLAKGEDTWRTRYGELRDVPLERWPADAVAYAQRDAEVTYRVFFAQGGEGHGCADLNLQVCGHMALHALSAWGMRTDPEAVAALEIDLLEATLAKRAELLQAGILKAKSKGGVSKDMKAIKARVEGALGALAPKTDKGATKTDDDTLARVDDYAIQLLREYQGDDKLLGTFVPVLWGGAATPINARYNVLVSTGRTSCGGPNMQQLPRKGGVRECFVPRPGHLFVSADWSAIEMVALAQVCLNLFGVSRLAEALNDDLDPHLFVAAKLAGIDYAEAKRRYDAGDEMIADLRQLSKIANFGYAGGMGAATFVDYARGYGRTISTEMGESLKRAWMGAWPEMSRYFEYISVITGDMGPKQIEQQVSGRVRGGIGFCDGANTLFQGLVADAAKHTLWELFKACYVNPAKALYGCRPVAFIHDEIIAEAPEDHAPEMGDALAQLMIDTASLWMPDVKVKAEPVLMRRWFKGAKTVRDAQGRLQVWEPKS